MAQQQVVLACTQCGARNYHYKTNQTRTERLAVNKFCKQCGRHTLHRQTK